MNESDLEQIEQIRAEEQVAEHHIPTVEIEPTPQEKPITEDRLAEALKSIFPQQPPPKEPEQRQLTPEEFKARYKVWEPSDQHVADFMSGDPAKVKAVLLALRDGINNQSVTMSDAIAERRMTPFVQQMQTLNDSQAEQVRNRSRDEFFIKYPHFKGHEEILSAVTTGLTASGNFNPKSMDDAHKQIAQKAEELMKRINPNFTVPKPENQQQNKTTTNTRMASTSRGGNGGTSGAKVTKEKPLELSIWDND